MLLRFAIEIGEQGTGADARAALGRIDANLTHRRQIDRQATVAERIAGDIVSSAAHREHEPVIAGEAHRLYDVVGAGAAHDDRRLAVDHRVPDGPGVFVAWSPWREHGAFYRGRESLDENPIKGEVESIGCANV